MMKNSSTYSVKSNRATSQRAVKRLRSLPPKKLTFITPKGA